MTPKTPPPGDDAQAEPDQEVEVEPEARDLEEAGQEVDVGEDGEDLAEEPAPVVPARPAPRAAPTRPWGGNRGLVSPEDLSPEELTPEMRWPPGSWVKVTDVVRRSTGEVIEGIQVGDVGQVVAALSQTLVLLFPTRDNRREVLHIESIEAVEAGPAAAP